jgi:hypothetical protein
MAGTSPRPRSKLLTQNQMLIRRHPTGQTARAKNLPIYINWYINDYGPPWTSSDVNSRMTPNHGKFADSSRTLLATTGANGQQPRSLGRSVSTSW